MFTKTINDLIGEQDEDKLLKMITTFMVGEDAAKGRTPGEMAISKEMDKLEKIAKHMDSIKKAPCRWTIKSGVKYWKCFTCGYGSEEAGASPICERCWDPKLHKGHNFIECEDMFEKPAF